MIIKTNGFKMPNGDIHTFIPPSPTENERGGIKAKAKTTEALEVAFDEASERLYAAIPNTDKTLSETGVAADAKTTGDKIKDKLDRNQGIEHYGKSLIVGEDGLVVPGEVQSGGDGIAIINTMSGESPLVIPDSAERVNKRLELGGKTEQVQTSGKNLFDVSKVVSNSQVINNGNGSIKVIADESNNGFSANTPNTLKDYCPLLIVGQAYTLSANTAATTKQIYLKESGTVWTYGQSVQITKEMLDSVVLFYSDVNKTSVISNIQIERGSTATAYEPYSSGKASPSPEYEQDIESAGKLNTDTRKYEIVIQVKGADTELQSLTLTSDRPLTQWDKLVEQDGQIGWLYKSRKIEFDGSETFDEGYLPSLLYNLEVGKYSEGGIFCNYSNSEGIGKGNNVGSTISFRKATTYWNCENAQQFKEFLKTKKDEGNPLYVFYETISTEFIPLPQSEQSAIRNLTTYYPSTTLTNDQGCVMELDYVTDTKNYIDNKFAQLQKSLINTNTQLL